MKKEYEDEKQQYKQSKRIRYSFVEDIKENRQTDYFAFDHEFLGRVSNRNVNEV